MPKQEGLKHRDSRFELLRIAAMLMIVLGHFATQSGIFSELRGASYHAFYYFISLGPRIGVDLFVMIGAWFLSDSDFRARRLLDLYLRLFLYCVPITILGKLFLPDVGSAGPRNSALFRLASLVCELLYHAFNGGTSPELRPFLSSSHREADSHRTCFNLSDPDLYASK